MKKNGCGRGKTRVGDICVSGPPRYSDDVIEIITEEGTPEGGIIQHLDYYTHIIKEDDIRDRLRSQAAVPYLKKNGMTFSGIIILLEDGGYTIQ